MANLSFAGQTINAGAKGDSGISNSNAAVISTQADLIDSNNQGKYFIIDSNITLSSDITLPNNIILTSEGKGVIDVNGYKVKFVNTIFKLNPYKRVFDFTYFTTRTYTYNATGGETFINTGISDIQPYRITIRVNGVELLDGDSSNREYYYNYNNGNGNFDLYLANTASPLTNGDVLTIEYTADADRSRIDDTSTFLNGDIDLYNFGMVGDGVEATNTGTDNRNVIIQAQKIFNTTNGEASLLRSGVYACSMHTPIEDDLSGMQIEGKTNFTFGKGVTLMAIANNLDNFSILTLKNFSGTLKGGLVLGDLENHDFSNAVGAGCKGITIGIGCDHARIFTPVKNTSGSCIASAPKVNFKYLNSITGTMFTSGDIDASGTISASTEYSYSDLIDVTNPDFLNYGILLSGGPYAGSFGLDVQSFYVAYYDNTDTFLRKSDLLYAYKIFRSFSDVAKIRLIIHTPKFLFANSTVKLTSGTSGSVDGITVSGVQIMSGAEAFDTNLKLTAKNVVANINAFTSTPNYTAKLIGDDTIGIESDNNTVFTASPTTTTITTLSESGGRGLYGTLGAPQYSKYIEIAPTTLTRGKFQGISNAPQFSKIHDIVFDEIGRDYEGTNGVGNTGNPGWGWDSEDLYQSLSNIEMWGCTFLNIKGGAIILKGSRDIWIHDNSFDQRDYPEFNNVSSISLANGEKTRFNNNVVRSWDMELGRQNNVYDNSIYDSNILFSMEDESFNDNKVLYDVFIGGVSTGQENGKAYIKNNFFQYTKSLENGKPIISFVDGMFIENNVFDLKNVNIDEGLTSVGDFGVEKPQGKIKDLTIKNAEFSDSLKSSGTYADFGTSDIDGLSISTSLRLFQGTIRDVLWKNVDITSGTFYGWFFNYPSTNSGSGYNTFTTDNFNITIDDPLYLSTKYAFYTAAKDVDLVFKNGSINIKIGSNTGYNKFFNCLNYGTKTFINSSFYTDNASSMQTLDSTYEFIDCTFTNITFTGAVFKYTYPDTNAPSYADNATALAALGEGYYYKNTTSGTYEITHQ